MKAAAADWISMDIPLENVAVAKAKLTVVPDSSRC